MSTVDMRYACAAESEPGPIAPWLCSLPVGHEGDHEAWTTKPTYPRFTWPQSPRTWSLPPEPGPEVTAVRDAAGRVWDRHFIGWRYRAEPRWVYSWSETLRSFGPLTDATPTPPESALAGSAQGDEAGAGSPIPAPAAGGGVQ